MRNTRNLPSHFLALSHWPQSEKNQDWLATFRHIYKTKIITTIITHSKRGVVFGWCKNWRSHDKKTTADTESQWSSETVKEISTKDVNSISPLNCTRRFYFHQVTVCCHFGNVHLPPEFCARYGCHCLLLLLLLFYAMISFFPSHSLLYICGLSIALSLCMWL